MTSISSALFKFFKLQQMVEFNVIFILSYVQVYRFLACSRNASMDTFYNPKVSLFKPPLAINC